MSIRLVTTLCLTLAAAGVGQVDAAGIGGQYSGRYQVANPSLRVQATAQGVEYWDASMADDAGGKRVLREAEPIDDVIDWLKKSKYSCVGSQQLRWNSEGTRATTAQDRVDTRETYVIECDGDCRGLRYVPMTDAIVYNFGRARPVPVLQMRNTRGAGAILQWVFTREPGGQPPEIYVHHWNAHGFNRTSGCKAPKSNNK